MRYEALVVLGLMLGLSSPAAAAACTAESDPAVTVAIEEAPLRTDRSFSHAALAARVGGVGPDWHAFGMTEVALGTEIDYGFVIADLGSRYCATFTKIEVTVTLSLVVNLASELKPGTCANQAIEEHEQQHVDLERRMLPLAQERVAAAIQRAARRGANGPALDAATQALQQEMSARIEHALQAYAEEKNRKHDVFDTREEYSKLTLRCSRQEIRNLLLDG